MCCLCICKLFSFLISDSCPHCIIVLYYLLYWLKSCALWPPGTWDLWHWIDISQSQLNLNNHIDCSQKSVFHLTCLIKTLDFNAKWKFCINTPSILKDETRNRFQILWWSFMKCPLHSLCFCQCCHCVFYSDLISVARRRWPVPDGERWRGDSPSEADAGWPTGIMAESHPGNATADTNGERKHQSTRWGVMGVWNLFICQSMDQCIIKEWDVHACVHVELRSGPRFNIKMPSYQYRKSHCGDKTILRPSYLHSGISYTGKTTSLYWIGALNSLTANRISKYQPKWLIDFPDTFITDSSMGRCTVQWR